MSDAAPTNTQAAPSPASAPAASVHDRIKSALFGSNSASRSDSAPSEPNDDQSGNRKASSSGVVPAPDVSSEQDVPEAQAEEVGAEDQAQTEVDADSSDDAQSEEAQPTTLQELAEAIGWDLDKVLDLAASTKVDGKDGTARLRDLVKSYQLDGHINQKLASFDNDRKAFEAKRQESERAVAEKLLRLDAGAKTLERALAAEFATVDWQKLQAENPLEFNSKFVQYQQRYAVLQDIANQIANEQKQYQETQQAKAHEKFSEEMKLLEAKIPEWADTTKRAKAKADIVDYLKGYGITKEEFEAIGDHRQLQVVRDALKWHQLQKSKPAVLNKVKAAPKLLKPGTTQSRAVVEGLAAKRERDTLKQTGRARDAVPILKRLLSQPQR